VTHPEGFCCHFTYVSSTNQIAGCESSVTPITSGNDKEDHHLRHQKASDSITEKQEMVGSLPATNVPFLNDIDNKSQGGPLDDVMLGNGAPKPQHWLPCRVLTWFEKKGKLFCSIRKNGKVVAKVMAHNGAFFEKAISTDDCVVTVSLAPPRMNITQSDGTNTQYDVSMGNDGRLGIIVLLSSTSMNKLKVKDKQVTSRSLGTKALFNDDAAHKGARELISIKASGTMLTHKKVSLTKGDYTFSVVGKLPKRGTHKIKVFLVGNVNGDKKIDGKDMTIIKSLKTAQYGDKKYTILADIDMSGDITSKDLRLAKANKWASATPNNSEHEPVYCDQTAEMSEVFYNTYDTLVLDNWTAEEVLWDVSYTSRATRFEFNVPFIKDEDGKNLQLSMANLSSTETVSAGENGTILHVPKFELTQSSCTNPAKVHVTFPRSVKNVCFDGMCHQILCQVSKVASRHSLESFNLIPGNYEPIFGNNTDCTMVETSLLG